VADLPCRAPWPGFFIGALPGQPRGCAMARGASYIQHSNCNLYASIVSGLSASSSPAQLRGI
jgi:hypothetical protein